MHPGYRPSLCPTTEAVRIGAEGAGIDTCPAIAVEVVVRPPWVDVGSKCGVAVVLVNVPADTPERQPKTPVQLVCSGGGTPRRPIIIIAVFFFSLCGEAAGAALVF